MSKVSMPVGDLPSQLWLFQPIRTPIRALSSFRKALKLGGDHVGQRPLQKPDASDHACLSSNAIVPIYRYEDSAPRADGETSPRQNTSYCLGTGIISNLPGTAGASAKSTINLLKITSS